MQKIIKTMAKTVNGNAFTSKLPQDDESHQMISSLFLGPHAENYEYFKDNVISILEATKEARLAYHPEDGVSALPTLSQIQLTGSSLSSVKPCRTPMSSRRTRARSLMPCKRQPSCWVSIRFPGGTLVMLPICAWILACQRS